MELAAFQSSGLVSAKHCRTIWEIRFSPLYSVQNTSSLLFTNFDATVHLRYIHCIVLRAIVFPNFLQWYVIFSGCYQLAAKDYIVLVWQVKVWLLASVCVFADVHQRQSISSRPDAKFHQVASADGSSCFSSWSATGHRPGRIPVRASLILFVQY